MNASEFYLLRAKDEFYADIDAKISMYEKFIKNNSDSPFKQFAQERLKNLKEEKFIKEN